MGEGVHYKGWSRFRNSREIMECCDLPVEKISGRIKPRTQMPCSVFTLWHGFSKPILFLFLDCAYICRLLFCLCTFHLSSAMGS